jgi:hypothetical protein
MSPLLVGGVADTDERLVKSKLWRGGKDELLVECGGFDCCVVTLGDLAAWPVLDQVLKSLLLAIMAFFCG